MIRNHRIVDKAPLEGLPMASWNRFAEAADEVLDGGWRANNRERRGHVVRIQNTIAQILITGEVLGIDDVLINNTANLEEYRARPTYVGVDAVEEHKGKFGVLIQPAGQNDIVLCKIAGVVPALVNVTDANHTHCEVDVTVGKYRMLSDTSGSARILYKPPGTGEALCWIRLADSSGGGDELYQFTLTEDMGATTAGDASATVAKPDGSGSGTQTVKDHPAGIFSVLKTGNVGWCVKVESDFWVIQADCIDPIYTEESGDGSLAGEGSFVLI